MSSTPSSPVCGTAGSGSPAAVSGPMIALFSTAVGVTVTNLFASQTLVGLIGASVGLRDDASGVVSMMTLLGYAVGLFLLVPLADLLENRRLVVRMLTCAALAAGAAAGAPQAAALLASLFLLGVACSAIQILVPLAASMAPPERRGRVIGDVMGGLMAGILISRPIASLIANAFGWRAFYGASAVAMAVLTAVLARRLPVRRPEVRSGYPALVGSLWHLLRDEPVLRVRALTASLVMAAFSVFWTSVALVLSQPPFGLSQRGIALFALAGAGGAVVTPLFGRAGDRGWTRVGTIASHLILMLAMALAAVAGSTASDTALVPLLALGLGAVLLDIGVTGDQTLGRRAINLIRPEARGRVNGLFVGLFFLGGAVGSAAAGYAWTAGGWPMICLLGGGFGAAALAVSVLS